MEASIRLAGAAGSPPGNVAPRAPPDPLAVGAWLLALPCAALTIAIVVLLGPPLSDVLYPARLPFTLLPNVVARPEPIEGTRYLLSLSAPVLLVACIVLTTRRRALTPRAAAAAAVVVQLFAAGVVVACFVRQAEPGWQHLFFTTWQLLAAVPIAAAVGVAARRGWLADRTSEPRAVRVVVAAVAILLTGAWFLSFVNTDQSIWWAGDAYNTGFQFDETSAVLNGLTPLVDFTPAYGSVWPLAIAPWMLLLGKTLLTYTLAMWALSTVAMLAIFGVLRRVTHSSVAALALYLPVMAFAFFAAVRDVHSPLAIYQELPLRNVGPLLLAWLVARHLDLGRRVLWPLFVVAGLATLDNVEFGVAALAATVAALIWTATPLGRRYALRLAAGAGIGVASAYGLLAVVTILRAGALPNPVKALAFDRIYGIGGVALAPLPHVIGLPLVVYLTYAAALGVATVRAARREPNRVLTGMLAWSAIFGFGSGAYYMGESVPNGIPTTFLPWGFAVALLTVAAVRQPRAGLGRLPSVATLAVLLGFGLMASFAFDPPASIEPWSQIEHIRTRPDDPQLAAVLEVATPIAAPREPALASFIRSAPEPRGRFVPLPHGAAVAIFWSTGHAIADAYGLRNVVPYIGESLFTVEQLDDALARLRAARGTVVLMPTLILGRALRGLVDRGFEVLTRSGFRRGLPGRDFAASEVVVRHGLTKWVDERSIPAGPR